MLDTISPPKYGGLKYYDGAIYYITDNLIHPFDEEGKPFITSFKASDGKSCLLFNGKLLDAVREYYMGAAIKLVRMSPDLLPSLINRPIKPRVVDDDDQSWRIRWILRNL